MFSGGNRNIVPTYKVHDDKLTLRPYNAELNKLSGSICEQLGKGSDDRCLFETRTAFDCVLRNKVRKYGDMMDV